MANPIIEKLESRKSSLEKEIQDLRKEQRTYSRKVSEIQVQIIGLTGELHATEDIIKELKNV